VPQNAVLAIDDEKDLIELVRYNLEKEGFIVHSAQDGESGLAAAMRDLPDVLVIDLMLPGMDGLELCRRFRSDARTAASRL
jgi:DNA-binding response OmpR family regulator